MKRLIALTMCAVSLGAAAQITYPYNPDGNADSLIGVSDIQDLLSGYGLAFSPAEIHYQNEPLSEVLTDILFKLDSLSNVSSSEQTSLVELYYSEPESCIYPGQLNYDLIAGFQVCKFTYTGNCINHVPTNCTGEFGTSSSPMYMSFEVSDTVWIDINSTFKGNACSYNNYGSSVNKELSSLPFSEDWNPQSDGWGLLQQHKIAVPGRIFVAMVDPNEATHLTELVDIEDQGPFENIRFWNSNGEEVNQFYAAYGGCGISNGYYTTSGSVLSYHHVVLSWFGL